MALYPRSFFLVRPAVDAVGHLSMVWLLAWFQVSQSPSSPDARKAPVCCATRSSRRTRAPSPPHYHVLRPPETDPLDAELDAPLKRRALVRIHGRGRWSTPRRR